jgi:hypothetical protein
MLQWKPRNPLLPVLINNSYTFLGTSDASKVPSKGSKLLWPLVNAEERGSVVG